jgi:hypothetical protein
VKSNAIPRFWKFFASLPRDVQETARETDERWLADPYHTSLHFKQIRGRGNLHSIRVGRSWRALGYLNGDPVDWIWIGSHAEYDGIIG